MRMVATGFALLCVPYVCMRIYLQSVWWVYICIISEFFYNLRSNVYYLNMHAKIINKKYRFAKVGLIYKFHK